MERASLNEEVYCLSNVYIYTQLVECLTSYLHVHIGLYKESPGLTTWANQTVRLILITYDSRLSSS